MQAYVHSTSQTNDIVTLPLLQKQEKEQEPSLYIPQGSHIMTSSGIGFDGFIKIPDRPLNFVPAKAGETIHLGQITCRILEDGSRTGMTPMRLC